MSASGVLFSGETLRPQTVTLEFTADDRLRVEGPGGPLDLALADVRVSERLGHIPRFLYLPGGAVIETTDNAAIDAALTSTRRHRAAQLIHRLESHPIAAAVACLVLLAVLAVTFHFAPAAVAEAAAKRVPPAVEQRAGEVALAAIAPYFSPSNLTAAERARVHAQLRRLRPLAPGAVPPRVEFRAFTHGLPNAFALSGNIIVVTDELVRLPIHDDELAAVLAHELGHLQARHGLQSVLRSSFALLIVSAVTGDLSTLTSFAGALPLSLLRNGYSREMERDADRFALAELQALHIDPHAFSTVLLKLETAQGALGRTSTYLSTHPSSEERIAMFGVLDDDAKEEVLAEGEADPKAIYQTRPKYPPALVRARAAGTVEIEFVVDTAGNVKNPRVVNSGDHRLDAPALQALQAWKFQPARSAFRAVERTMRVPMFFQLSDASPPTSTTSSPQ